MPICQRVPMLTSNGVIAATSEAPGPAIMNTKPASYVVNVMSKLRTGPCVLLSHAWQVPPPATHAVGVATMQVLPACVPPSQTPMAVAVGSGYGSRSGSAVGIGERLFGLVFCVNPVNPVSSPFADGLPPDVEPSGSWRGPKVRCRTSPAFFGSTLAPLLKFAIW